MAHNVRRFYDFGEFRLDADRHRLLRNGEVIPLAPKAIETLTALVQNPGKLLEREELMQAIWADTFVEDANLTVAISQLRKALGRDATTDYIQTIPRIGYRFVAPVITVEDRPAPLSIEKHTVSQTIVEEEIICDDGTASNGVTPADNKHSTITAIKTSNSEPRALIVNERQSLPFPQRVSVSGRQMLLVLSILAIAVTSAFVYSTSRSKPNLPATRSQVKSLAVLPFSTLHSRSDDEYLGLGLADALITQLGRVRHVSIRPLSAVRQYERIEHDPLAVGRALGVEAVLEGSILREGDQLRVTMRLLRVGDGVVLWSGKFDEKFTDIFTIQDSISQQVVQASVLSLSNEERELLTKRSTVDPEAFRLYLKGRYFWNKRTAEGIQQSIRQFTQAIDRDPTFALAFAGLADAYALGVWQDSLPQKEFIGKAKAAALRALEIDPTMGEPYASLGFIKFWYEWDFAGAESAFQRAIELNPNHATAHHWYGEFLVLSRRPEPGFKELRLAQEADPLSVIINSEIGKMLFFTHQNDEAIEQLQKTIEMDSQFPVAHLFLAMSYHKKGMTDQALAALQQEANIPSSGTVFKFVRAYIYAQTGRSTEAASILKELQQSKQDRFMPSYGIALIYLGLGERDKALAWLERASAEHDPFLVYLNVDPNFDSLRDDPRFIELLQKIGFSV